MRVLVLYRGAPGCGKSYHIDQMGWRQYALSADSIRLMIQSPVMTVFGGTAISQSNDNVVWRMLFDMLETRMQRGEFTVIDATNSKTIEMTRYRDLAQTYRYRIYVIDMTDIPIKVVKERNMSRDKYKFVPEDVIDRMYSRFATQQVPSGIKVIKPDQVDQIEYKIQDLSKYSKIHHIGDVHGCYQPLIEYFEQIGGLKDDEYYIFHGDFVDRGTQNSEVLEFLFPLINKNNVALLEGNHESALWRFANDMAPFSKEFSMYTQKELELHGTDKTKIRNLYRKLGQIVYYKYGDKIVLATHGGIPTMPQGLIYIATEELMRGVGNYEDAHTVCRTWSATTPSECFQVFGHRNIEELPIDVTSDTRSTRCINLEGQVERGGKLRIATLNKNCWEYIEIQNTVEPPLRVMPEVVPIAVVDNMSQLEVLRKNRYIDEKVFGDISSFNFSRSAFYDKVWNSQTMRARGLFMNNVTGEIVARSYDKFFNVGERESTKWMNLKYSFKFPVTAYVKENGFLGISGYNSVDRSLFLASKSNPTGPYADMFKSIFWKQLSDQAALMDNPHLSDDLKDILCFAPLSLVFEVIDPVNDPHIIEYPNDEIILLDGILRQTDYAKLPYDQLKELGARFGFKVKRRAYVFNTWKELASWYNEINEPDWLYEGKHIEGFVLEDASGFMTKLKLPYYHFWKQMRGVATYSGNHGYFRGTAELTTPLANYFYGFIKGKSREELKEKSIIQLRNEFYKDNKYGQTDV